MAREEQRPEADPLTTSRRAYQAHVESAEEADQTFRDEALARQIQYEYNSSLLVNPTDSYSSMSRRSRPPRCSQVVRQPPELPRWTRDDEMLGRQIQDQYHSSLFVEDSQLRERQPPRYSQVIDAQSSRDRRRDEVLTRQMQEQCTSSLDVNVSMSSARPQGSRSKRRARSSDHAVRRDEAGSRQGQEQRNSSLAVNQSCSTLRHPLHKRMSIDDSPRPTPFEHREHGESMLFDSSPHHQVPQRDDIHRPESYYHHPTYHGQVPLLDGNVYHPWQGPETKPNTKEPRKDKKPQIRAKNHEHALRWLAGRRSLGGR